MSIKDCSIIIPFAYNPVFLQTCVASFKENTDLRKVDIIVVDNHESLARQGKDIRVLTETALGEGITVVPQGFMLDEKRAYATHGSALNYVMPMIKTPYLFCTESDVTAARKDWLDFYMSFLPAHMIGWFWPARQYINPSWTLLDMEVLRKIHAEVQANKSTEFKWAPDFNRDRTHHEEHWRNLIAKNLLGAFDERRGYARNPETGALEKDLCRDDHDTGSWLYFRMNDEYICKRVPGHEISVPMWKELRRAPTKYQFIGDDEHNAYLYHHSAGTVAHDYEKHLITVEWQSYCMEFWLEREYRMWEEMVPEFIRKDTLAKGLVSPKEVEIERALSRIHIINIGNRVRAYHGEVETFIMGSMPIPNTPGDGLNAKVIGHDPFEDLWIIEFEEKPSEDYPYYKQRQDNGKWLANAHSKWLVHQK